MQRAMLESWHEASLMIPCSVQGKRQSFVLFRITPGPFFYTSTFLFLEH